MKVLFPFLLTLATAQKEKEKWVTLEEGEFGDWLQERKANENHYLCGLQAMQDTIQAKNLGLVGLKAIFCHFGHWSQQEQRIELTKDLGELALGHKLEWKTATKCPRNSFVSGIKV